MLLDTSEKLVGVEFLFAGSGAAQNADVQNHDVPPSRLHTIQNISEVVHIKVIADGNQNIAGLGADGFGSQLAFQFKIELVHFDVRHAATPRAFFGNSKYDVQQHGKSAAGHGGDRLGKQVHECDQEQRQRYQAQTNRNLLAANCKVQGNLKFSLAGTGIAQHQYRQAVHHKTS